MRKFIILFYSGLFLFLAHSYSLQAQEGWKQQDERLEHTFYVIGNIGNDLQGEAQKVLKEIVTASKEDETATLLVPGNFLPQYHPQNNIQQEAQKEMLKKYLLNPLKEFNGKIVFTPGVNEWKKGGQEEIDDLESFLQDNQNNTEVWPDDGCPIEDEDITDEIVLVTVDTQWYLEDWDEHPNMNSKCDIKTREQFFAEFKDAIKDAHGKTILVSLSHPIMSNSNENFFSKIGGFSPQDFQNERNSYLRGRLETLASQFDNVIFISGNEANLQYLEDDGIPQIISGNIGKPKKYSIRKEKHFASTKKGYVRLKTFSNNKTIVDFFALDEGSPRLIFSKTIKNDEPNWDEISFKSKEEVGETVKASIYTKEETEKSGLHKSLFGDFYREVYSKEKPHRYYFWIL